MSFREKEKQTLVLISEQEHMLGRTTRSRGANFFFGLQTYGLFQRQRMLQVLLPDFTGCDHTRSP